MDVGKLLAERGVDTFHLEPAPAATRRDVVARVTGPPRPCTACGEPSCTTRIHATADGPRWVDLCWQHARATAPQWRGPSTLQGIVADLREAALEAGVPLTIHTDEAGWQDEPHA